MWPFPPRKPPPEPPAESLAGLRADLDAALSVVARVRREWEEQQLDYAEVLAKLARWAGRQSARERKTMSTALEGEPGHQMQLLPNDPNSETGRAAEKARLRKLAANLRGGRGNVAGNSGS